MPGKPLSLKIPLRRILDIMPIPVFVADEKTRISDLNKAAQQLTGSSPETVLQHLCGTVLSCFNESSYKQECGQTEKCPDCIIRQSICKAINGKDVIRKRADMIRTGPDGKPEKVVFLITAAPFVHSKKALALVALEDISKLIELRNLIPICAGCRKIRNNDDLWENADKYLEKYGGVSYTHGMCPDCVKKMYGNILDETESAENHSPGK